MQETAWFLRGDLAFQGTFDKKDKAPFGDALQRAVSGVFFAANQNHELPFLRDETYPAFFTGVVPPVDGGFTAYSGV